MLEIVSWLAILVAIAAVSVVGLLYVRGSFAGAGSAFFRPRAEPRIYVVEQTTLDSKRRLILIRRDTVEHLLMTGGPVDVVIETGIVPPPRETSYVPDDSRVASSTFAHSAPDLGMRGAAVMDQPSRTGLFAGRRAPPVPASSAANPTLDPFGQNDGQAITQTLKADRS